MTAPWPLVETTAEERTPSNRPVASASKTGSTVDGQPDACSMTQHKHPNHLPRHRHPLHSQSIASLYTQTHVDDTTANTRCHAHHGIVHQQPIATYNNTTQQETNCRPAPWHRRQASRVYAKAAIRQAKSNMRIEKSRDRLNNISEPRRKMTTSS
jgi:hypothetical protein